MAFKLQVEYRSDFLRRQKGVKNPSSHRIWDANSQVDSEPLTEIRTESC